MRQSPRTRRLLADFRAVRRLSDESSIFEFEASGSVPETYRFVFHGLGVCRVNQRQVAVRDQHMVLVELGAAYPRLMPNLSWQTPIFHPNISSSGVVCLGGYGTHWVPSLTLDEMCIMLWDMIRYKNYDTESPYNREAAIWAREQTQFALPLDLRSLRNRVAESARPNSAGGVERAPNSAGSQLGGDEIEIIDADVVDSGPTDKDNDIVFID